jgi:hypothetical protein
VGRQYRPRAGGEAGIKPREADFALPQLGRQKSWSTEAARGLAIRSSNLTPWCQRHLGGLARVRAATLRVRLFTTGGILSRVYSVPTTNEHA